MNMLACVSKALFEVYTYLITNYDNPIMLGNLVWWVYAAAEGAIHSRSATGVFL